MGLLGVLPIYHPGSDQSGIRMQMLLDCVFKENTKKLDLPVQSYRSAVGTSPGRAKGEGA